MSTQEILDELRPQMSPIEPSFHDTMRMFRLLLPLNLPPELHHQGFKCLRVLHQFNRFIKPWRSRVS